MVREFSVPSGSQRRGKGLHRFGFLKEASRRRQPFCIFSGRRFFPPGGFDREHRAVDQ
jgi:hypothetical protein